nr:aspartate-alanine antiporter [Bacteroidota bacterium]
MEWIITTFRENPTLAIFFTIALGFLIGRFRYKNFSLGTVTSVLLIGVLVGQMKIPISPDVKNIFFLIFLFSVGYSVGPQFFNSLKKSGLPQLLFTVLMAVFSLIVPWLLARWMNYNAGQTAGMFAGSQTISAVIGVGADTIGNLSVDAATKKSMVNSVAICYAVTYLFGTIGSAIILAQIGPLFWGGLKKVKQTCRELEEEMGLGTTNVPTMISSFSNIVFRACHITESSVAIGKSVKQLEDYFASRGYYIYVERIRTKGSKDIMDAMPDYVFQPHDDIVIQGRGAFVITEMKEIGKEIFDHHLLDFPLDHVKVLLVNKKVNGMTISELSQQRGDFKISIKKLTRGGVDLPILAGTILHVGDMLYLIGPRKDVNKAVKELGYPDVETEKTDMISVGTGILIGGFIGVLALHIGKATISLSTSGGVLIAGLILGWLRSKHPTFAQIPEPALWMMNNLGLNAFIAVVGISAGPGFVAGFYEVGPMLFVIGAIATTVPLMLGIIMARYLFKFDPALGLGCCCGARTTTAGLPAVQDALESKLPAIGYTVTYAAGNTLLIICGIIIVFLMS